MATDLKQKIIENAQVPKKAQGDIGSVEQQSLTEQIAAYRYAKSGTAANKGFGALNRVEPLHHAALLGQIRPHLDHMGQIGLDRLGIGTCCGLYVAGT